MLKLKITFAATLLCCMNAMADQGIIDRGPATGWENLGTGEYYDGLICDVFPEFGTDQHWNVLIQNNPGNPGWYRFVPFSGDWPGVDIAGESMAYMIINASNPEKVYMCDTDKIFHISGWQYIFSQNVPENLEDGAIYGTLVNGVVNFPANSFVFYKCSPVDSYDRTQKETVNRTGSLKIVLPAGASVSTVIADSDEKAEYFNLYGIKVENPVHGIYIKKTGAEAQRVFIQ